MYFCHKTSRGAKTLQLVESRRDRWKTNSSHRVVVSLGGADVPKEIWRAVADGVEAKLKGQPWLPGGGLTPDVARWVDHTIGAIERKTAKAAPAKLHSSEAESGETLDGVLIAGAGHTRSTILGPIVLGLHAWRSLEMDRLLAGLGYSDVQRKTAAASVLSRLVEPMSENALAEWLPESSFADIFGREFLQGVCNRLYRVSDKLLEDKDSLEEHLRRMAPAKLGIERTILLYDLTNTHFEGRCAGNPKARRGHNKQKRDDCPQIAVGMIFDEHGFAMGHKTFVGNVGDSKTLRIMLDELKKASGGNQPPLARTLVVVDAGMATKENVSLLKGAGFGYLVNDSRRRRSAWASEFAADGFEPVPGRVGEDSVLVRRLDSADSEGLDPEERVVLCKSQGREDKERAILSNAEGRLLDELGKLAKRVSEGRLTDQLKIERAIGKTRARHSRAAHLYKIWFDQEATALRWELDRKRRDDQDSLFGCYVLRASGIDLSAAELWRLYMTLTRAEDGFNSLKHDVGLRPAFHQIEGRVDAHVFVTVLAYHMLRYITHGLEKGGDRREWSSVKRMLSTHCYATIVLPTKDGRIHRIRKPGTPDESQWAAYHKFGITSMEDMPNVRTVATVS